MAATPSTTSDKLRTVAALLDAHPGLPAPMITAYTYGGIEIDWLLSTKDEQKDTARLIRRTLGGTWDKIDASSYLLLRRDLDDDIRFQITLSRDQVCERVIVGVETVTIPAVEAQPERTEDREVVEWRCDPILTDDATEAVSA